MTGRIGRVLAAARLNALDVSAGRADEMATIAAAIPRARPI